MSRTIHKRRQTTKANPSVNLEPESLQKIVTQRQNWRKKELSKERRSKKRSRRERWGLVLESPHVDLEEIDIRILDEGKYIHYPASINDIVRAMHSLPMEMLDGIAAIELRMGVEYQEDYLYQETFSYKPDPLTGRCGYEVLPGIFCAPSGGNYSRSPATIRLFAYVYDPEVREREMWELYLRLEMLRAFIWHVARHHYFTAPVPRKEGEDSDSYAYRMVGELLPQCVIPYLEKTYPEALGALDVWLQHHLCLSTPLSQIATKPNLLELLFKNRGVLEKLACDVATGKELTEAFLKVAWMLYYNQHYAAALEIANRLLSDEQNYSEALLIAANINLQMENYEAAQTVAERLLSNDESNLSHWLILAKVYELRQKWGDFLDCATRFLENNWISLSEKSFILEKCARARLELGDFEGMEADLQQLSEIGGSRGAEVAYQLREKWRSRQVRYVY